MQDKKYMTKRERVKDLAAAYFARAECPEVLMGANVDYESGTGDSAEEEANIHA